MFLKNLISSQNLFAKLKSLTFLKPIVKTAFQTTGHLGLREIFSRSLCVVSFGFFILLMSPQLFAAQIKMIPTRNEMSQRSFASDAGRIMSVVSTQINKDQYRDVKVQVIRNADGSPHHVLVYLFRIGFHQMRLMSLYLDPQYHVSSVNNNYRMQLADVEQQPGTGLTTPPKCPDPNIEFISFAPNEMDLEQQTATEVAQFAASHGLKTLTLFKEKATRQNYLDAMSCPNLKGNFYDGDSNPSSFVTVDGSITSDEMVHFLSGAMKYRVTNIWLACEAFNDPLKSVMIDKVQSQKFAAGINDLLVGPSDKAAACAMEAAISGQPMTQAFQDCYQKLDNPQDKWGFDGKGSDLFGQLNH